VTDFSAKESGLGYLFQARYALWLILDGPEERETVLESLDDISLESEGLASELLQTKHHTVPASLTNASAELWKTLRIWSTHLKNGTVSLPRTALSLVTTATAPVDSVASMLRRDSGRNVKSALEELRRVSRDSENASLSAAFSAFNSLSAEQQRILVDSITIIDASPDIAAIEGRIRDKLRLAVDRQYRDALYERLEGYWLGRVIEQLRSVTSIPVAGFEVYDKVVSIAQQFGPGGLPIDYLDARPETLDPAGDTRMFVKQLRAIDVGIGRIEKAMLDFYRAFEQRSRWAREELLIGDEVELYENRLIDEWERFSMALVEELSPAASELEQRKVGRQIFNWMEQTADVRIRPNVTEPYVMRGSFHVLADGSAPRVWWHPKFLERVAEILGAEHDSAS
jgi:hypothetical protein